ncbi:uncharacterized protein RHOBADRAFT_41687 [Rhodotorula graminis WP1]|uniref:ML-like domain-containing protein n=1 Tax=Rhodotorula graminis (strain WP1) TaxID=578459 RepID=A0A194SE06_RHOGW|nr:uncharacterized protein RHOBADRAFT_41687 [Rhodotorula graminis WP1]KPV77691.1 hypothetical protein RHOBADRAFT_41687 [Rhodotorula graminis WP1]
MRLLAGLHALVLLSLASQAHARRRFYARAVSYCSDARAIEVDQFLLQYFPDETLFGSGAGTISFDISAASVDPNLNAKLEFSLDAYGIDAVNTTIDLCSLLGGILCPLPTYDFVGSATLPLPAEVGDSIDIPGIGYWIPDLEATATVRLLRVEDNSEAACLRVELSNGKTARFASVSWALGGVAMFCALLSALWFLVGTLVWPSTAILASSPHANALWASLGRRKERLLLFMSLVQFVATTGLLSVQYPRIYEAFTANFAWGLGFIRINPVIRSIDRMRNATGGNLTQIAGTSTLVGGTDALKSIFSRDVVTLPSAPEVASAIFTELAKSISSGTPASSSAPPSLSARGLSVASTLVSRQLGVTSSTPDGDAPFTDAIVVPDVTNSSTIDSVRYGLPHYLVNLDISPFDGFMITFINFLFLCAIAIALALVGGALWALVRCVKGRKAERRRRRLGLSGEAGVRETAYGSSGGKWGGLLVAWYPILLLSFFQWTIGSADSWAPIVLSVLTTVFTTAAILFLAFRFFVLARRSFRPSYGSIEDPTTFDAPPVLTFPFGPTPSSPPVSPNPDPKRALRKAERREVETHERGRFLASGLAPYSPLWNAYKVRSRRSTAKRRNWWKGRAWWFGLVELVVAPFVTALFVGFARNSGWTQTVAVLAIQALLFLALCIWSPYEDKSSNGTHIFWALLRVVIAGALIPFNESIGLNEIVRVAIGAVLLVIISVSVVLFAVLLFVDFVQLCIFLVRGIKDRRRHRGALNGDSVVDAPASAPLAPGEKPPSPRPAGFGPDDDDLDARRPRGDSLERGATSRSSTTLDDELGRPVAGKSVTP